MKIEVQQTPNPNALKFVLADKQFDRPVNISVQDDTDHPLAQKLLALEPVYNVFMVQDFITVNKLPGVAWEPLTEQVRQILADHFRDGKREDR